MHISQIFALNMLFQLYCMQARCCCHPPSVRERNLKDILNSKIPYIASPIVTGLVQIFFLPPRNFSIMKSQFTCHLLLEAFHKSQWPDRSSSPVVLSIVGLSLEEHLTQHRGTCLLSPRPPHPARVPPAGASTFISESLVPF